MNTRFLKYISLGCAVAITMTLLAPAQAEVRDTDPQTWSTAAAESIRLQLAALDTPNGPPPCGADGVCNLAVCSRDPDCPADMPANTNSPDTGNGSPLEELTLRIQFNITRAAGPDATSQKAAVTRIWKWIAEAEAIFTRVPRLNIIPSYRYNTINVPTSFKNMREAKRFLKDHYDNIVGDEKGQGKLVVAVTASGTTLTKNPNKTDDDDSFGGVAYFPDSVKPFALKHGIALNMNKADASLAHELGHIFGLLHADASDAGLFNKNCNKDFSDTTTRSGTSVNLMDGFGLSNGDNVWLNECQKDKAADHRRRLLTKDGKTNYSKL